MDFHPWKSNLKLIIVLPEQHYNNPKHSCQVCFGWGWSATPPHPYKPLGHWARPLPHRKETFCLSPKGWGKVYIFHHPPSALDLHNFIVWSLLLSSNHFINIDVDRLLTCPIHASIEEVMVVLTLVVPGSTPKSLLSQGVVPRQCPTQIAISHSSHIRLGSYWTF